MANRSRTRARHPSLYKGFISQQNPDGMYQDDAKTQKLSTDDAGANPLMTGDAINLTMNDAQTNQVYMDDAKSNPIQGDDL